jgi:hypothetical protein
MRKVLAIVAMMSAASGCSYGSIEPIQIMRMKDSNTPYKGYILEEIYKNADGSALVLFETCAGNIWQLSTNDVSYEGDFPTIECSSLARRGGKIQ